MEVAEFKDNSMPGAPVRGYLHRAHGAAAHALVLTHGAGANCTAPLLVALADAFNAAGLAVLRCDLPFRQARQHGPPPRGSAENDQAGLRAAVAALRRETTGRVFLGGHSYGGRQASIVAADEPELVTALLLLSYPLHPPEKPDQMRTGHFPFLKTSALFVSGERDEFATRAEMENALKLIPARTELMTVKGAGHALMTNRNRAELTGRVVEEFLKFEKSRLIPG